MPKPYVTPAQEQGHQKGVGPDPRGSDACNHAGVEITPNEPAYGEAEAARWEATLAEVEGFVWEGILTVEDPTPPTYRVANIRRQNGEMFAVVTTSQYDVQHDHHLRDIRRRRYRLEVADKVIGPLPFMLEWRQLAESTLTIDFKTMYDVVRSYSTASR